MTEAKINVEVKGIKQYDDPNYKDPEPEKEENIVMVGNTVIKPIPYEDLTLECQQLITEKGKGWITRNSTCPCGSGKRFKKCCLEFK